MSNIYMEYLSESEREDLILEKEIDLINSDIDYLLTTYEATDDNETKGNILQRLWERIEKLIKKIREDVIPRIINKIKRKKDVKVTNNNDSKNGIKALPSPKPDETDNNSKTEYMLRVDKSKYKAYKEAIKLWNDEKKFLSKFEKVNNMNYNNINESLLREFETENNKLKRRVDNIIETNESSNEKIICPEQDLFDKITNILEEISTYLNQYSEISKKLKQTAVASAIGKHMKKRLNAKSVEEYQKLKKMTDDDMSGIRIYNILYDNIDIVVFKIMTIITDTL